MTVAPAPRSDGRFPPDAARTREIALSVPVTRELVDVLADLVADRLAERFVRADGPTWLNAEQAAEYIAAPVGRIHDLVSQRRLRPRRDGRRLVFLRSDLDAYLEGSG